MKKTVPTQFHIEQYRANKARALDPSTHEEARKKIEESRAAMKEQIEYGEQQLVELDKWEADHTYVPNEDLFDWPAGVLDGVVAAS